MKAHLLALLGLFSAMACESEGPRAPDAELGGRVGTAPVAVALVASIGQISGSDPEAFGRVSAVAMDSREVVYVADQQSSTVSAFDADGAFLGEVGGAGEGPGEYQGPAAITVSRTDQLYLRDSRGVTVVKVRLTPFGVDVLDTWGGPVFPNSPLAGALDQDGRYYFPYSRSLRRDGGAPEHFYLVYEQGVVVDTVMVPSLASIRATDPAWYRTGRSGGRILPGLSRVPFAASPLWDIAPGLGVVSADGDAAVMQITAGPDRDSIQIGSGDCVPIPASERGDSLDALTRRLDSIPVPLDEVQGLPPSVRELRLPECLPTAVGIRVSETGLIWVRRWPTGEAKGGTRYDVFRPGGVFLADVQLPVDVDPTVPPWIGDSRIVIVRQDPGSGIDVVEWYDFVIEGSA